MTRPLQTRLLALGAGVALSNGSPHAGQLFRYVENTVYPIYVLFFIAAGRDLHQHLPRARHRHGPRLEALEADVLAADLAFTVAADVDLLERGVDLGEEPLLALAQATRELQIDLGRCGVDLIGKIIGVEVNVSLERLALIALE